MAETKIHAKFDGRLVIIGFGTIGQGVLPLILRHIGINKALISAGGVDVARGVSCWNFHEVPIKQAAMVSAVERHLVVDSSKFGLVRAVRFAQIGDFDSVISEQGQQLRSAH